MNDLSMFLSSDQEKVTKEFDCCGFLLVHLIHNIAIGDFDKATKFYDDIGKSLRELQRMKSEKEMYDAAKKLLEKVNARQLEEIKKTTLRSGQ